MCYTGKVHNGVVVLDNGADLAEGTVVRIEPVQEARELAEGEEIPTLYEQLEPLIGSVEGLPSDMARNHDHYLHGTPKK